MAGRKISTAASTIHFNVFMNYPPFFAVIGNKNSHVRKLQNPKLPYFKYNLLIG
jgi:hypothetical protein